ncbi:hypothetical protein AHMF7605_26195 [Adhaeribacter arboris]|uniref:Uncharacterized protein n=1 Tax=Adhaeribacter arboris TaxID=2072846 RepID=A0A2T2YMK5_9BACT|nr:hypothetical protein [Adhaeribacter arboris]PSR56737.1 hypothetical protein AHMF7605_26195 [Adhaeribacter arboris]
MAKVARKKALRDTPKFNIRLRYEKLNDDQKMLLRAEHEKTFGLGDRAFYRDLNKDLLSDEILQFFADMFGCNLADLFCHKPPIRPTVYELERKYDKHQKRLGKQTNASI